MNPANRATANTNPIVNNPGDNIVIANDRLDASDVFNLHETMNTIIIDTKKLIIAIINASEKKILNTSHPLAPTALNIPISLRLLEIDNDT